MKNRNQRFETDCSALNFRRERWDISRREITVKTALLKNHKRIYFDASLPDQKHFAFNQCKGRKLFMDRDSIFVALEYLCRSGIKNAPFGAVLQDAVSISPLESENDIENGLTLDLKEFRDSVMHQDQKEADAQPQRKMRHHSHGLTVTKTIHFNNIFCPEPGMVNHNLLSVLSS